MRDWSAELIAQRRAAPADDLITGLLHAEIEGNRLDDDDITDVISGFVFAGSETTKRQLTRAIGAFGEHPDSWERMAADPSLIDGAVEEVLRTHSIIPGLSRMAVEGWGPHFCMGAGPARVELQESLRALAARFGPPQIHVDDLSSEIPTGPAFGAPDELHVTFADRT